MAMKVQRVAVDHIQFLTFQVSFRKGKFSRKCKRMEARGTGTTILLSYR